MGTIYVSTGGNDTTGDGTLGNPYRSLSKGLTVAVGGDTISMATGTYQESTAGQGYLRLGVTYGSLVTVTTTTGTRDVTVQGFASNFNVLQVADISNLKFEHINFTARVGSTYSAFETSLSYDCSLQFSDCWFEPDDSSGPSGFEVYDPVGSAKTHTYTFTSCAFHHVNSGTGYGFKCDVGTVYTINLTMTTCTVDSNSFGAIINGVDSFTITGGTFRTQGLTTHPALTFGRDAASGNGATGTLSGAFVESSTSHSLLIGADSTVVVDNCVLYGGDWAVVIKAAVNAEVKNSTLMGGTQGALLLKGANSANVHDCNILGRLNRCVANYDGDPSYQSVSCQVVDNYIIAVATSDIFFWSASGDGTPGSTIDRNSYHLYGSGDYGQVRAANNIASLTALWAAWSGYTPANNDASSWAINQANPDGDPADITGFTYLTTVAGDVLDEWTHMRNDRLPKLQLILNCGTTAGNSALSAALGSGATARVHITGVDGLLLNAQMDITDSGAREVSYDWQTGDVDTSGLYTMEVEVSIGVRKVTFGPVYLRIADDIV